MSDPAILNEVSADRIRRHIEKIVREIPHRAAGSANGKRMAEYSRDAELAAQSLTIYVRNAGEAALKRLDSVRDVISE